MLELAADLHAELAAGEPVAVVTVARVARSAPRGIGAAMALTRSGRVLGSISGGCVESDALVLAAETLATGRGRTATLGFTDEDAHAAGLACGGSVDVIVQRIDPSDAATVRALADAAADRESAVAVIATGGRAGETVPVAALRPFGPAGLPRDTRLLTGALVTPAADADVLLVVHAPRPRLIVVGAGEHAMALCRVGAAAGFAVTVTDTWELLVTPERFPSAERLVVGMPHEHLADLVGAAPAHAAVCVLTHDERVDVPALAAAFALGVGFVGAMGSRGTVARRATLLRDAGIGADDLGRLRSPLGLDLGGSSPDETALSVLAEIVAARRGGGGRPLRDHDGPLHARPDGVPQAACTVDGTVA